MLANIGLIKRNTKITIDELNKYLRMKSINYQISNYVLSEIPISLLINKAST